MTRFFLFAIGFSFLASENRVAVAGNSDFHVSSQLLHSVCEQRRVFSRSKILQEPVKSRPEKSGYLAGKSEANQNPDFPCGWFALTVSVAPSENKFKYKNCKGLAVSSGGNPENGDLNPDFRVVGGQDATPHQFPSIVELITKNKEHWCAGVIISEKWILTAAHCLEARGVEDRFARKESETSPGQRDDSPEPAVTAIVAGEHDRRTDDGTEQIRQVEKLIPHPDYVATTEGLDIGLVKLTEPLEFNGNVSPVTLPTKETLPAGIGQICGWGTVKNPAKRNGAADSDSDLDAPEQSKSGFDSDSPPVDEAGMAFVLQTSPIPMFSREECQKLMDAAGYPLVRVAEGDLCAAYADKEINVCSGDSGGPIFDLNSQAGKQIVLGLVSSGPDFKCAGPNYPTIFTGVPYSLDWIQKTIEENS